MAEPHFRRDFSDETVVMDDLDEDGKRKAWKTED